MNEHDLTVVLILKDRSSFTYRWMLWMAEQNFPYKILIADGGADKDIEKHLENRNNYPNLDYEYLRYPYDGDFDAYVKKLADVAEHVTTKFVITADNDDLILLEPLERNLDVLRNRQEIHTVGPVHYRFKINKHSETVDDFTWAGDSHITVRKTRHANNPTLSDADPLKRLTEVVEHFYSECLFYGIHRLDDYKRCYRGLQRMKARRSIFYEWHALYSYAVAGKLLLGSTEPFLLRQEGTSQAAGPAYFLENHSNVFLLPDWSGQLYGMIDGLYLQCAEMGCKLDRAAFEELFRAAFRKHMLSWIEFRGLADKFRKFPGLYVWGRKLFAFYRGKGNPEIPAKELRANKSLSQAIRFLSRSNISQLNPIG